MRMMENGLLFCPDIHSSIYVKLALTSLVGSPGESTGVEHLLCTWVCGSKPKAQCMLSVKHAKNIRINLGTVSPRHTGTNAELGSREPGEEVLKGKLIFRS